MIRRLTIVLLIVTFGFLIREAVTAWQEDTSQLQPPPAPARPVKMAPVGKITFNPRVAPQLPDLRRGYLFNEQRNLAIEEEQEAQADSEDDGTLDDVTYNGSIISNEIRKGMISYPLKKEPEQARNIRRRVARAPAKEEQIYEILSPGDRFRGFEVLEVLPEKIVFGKDDRKTEKFLYDLNKIRIQPPPTSRAATTSSEDKEVEEDADAAATRLRQLQSEEKVRGNARGQKWPAKSDTIGQKGQPGISAKQNPQEEEPEEED